MSWPRVAPAARNRPSSRTRSTTVIDSVLKIRKAPANSAIAAISAVVGGEIRGRGPQRGREVAPATRARTARSSSRDSIASVTSPRVAPSGRGRCRAGSAASAPKTACAVASGTRTVRPSAPPTARRRRGCRRPRYVDGVDARGPRRSSRSRGRPRAASARADERRRSRLAPASQSPAASGRSCSRGSAAGSMPTIVTGGGQGRSRRRTGRCRGRCGARARRDDLDARRRGDRSERVRREAGLAERRDAEVGAADGRADGPVDRGARSRRSWPGRRTARATPSATPTIVSGGPQRTRPQAAPGERR